MEMVEGEYAVLFGCVKALNDYMLGGEEKKNGRV